MVSQPALSIATTIKPAHLLSGNRISRITRRDSSTRLHAMRLQRDKRPVEVGHCCNRRARRGAAALDIADRIDDAALDALECRYALLYLRVRLRSIGWRCVLGCDGCSPRAASQVLRHPAGH